MAENESKHTLTTEPQQLSDNDLKEVSGGWVQTGPGFTAWGWSKSDEDALQADYAAHGAGMSLDDFIKTRGISREELTCRGNYLQQLEIDKLYRGL